MSARENHHKEDRIPFGIVFITIGLIILLTVAGIWLVAPHLMPGPLQQALSPLRTQVDSILPTRAAVAAAPPYEGTDDAQTKILVPETAVAPTSNALVNAQEAAKQDPFTGWPVRIEIPAIDLEAPIDQVGLDPVPGPNGQTFYQWQVPDAFQAGWHYNSAMLGEKDNLVLNGHHNVHGEVFRKLVDLEVGDVVVLYDRNQAYRYEVSLIEILAERGQPLDVRLENAAWIQSTEDERITLVTCWPYTDNSHRLVVVAKPATDTANNQPGTISQDNTGSPADVDGR